MRTNLVKIVLVFVFEAGERDLVQVYHLLEVRPPVGAVGEVGVLKMGNGIIGHFYYNVKTTF